MAEPPEDKMTQESERDQGSLDVVFYIPVHSIAFNLTTLTYFSCRVMEFREVIGLTYCRFPSIHYGMTFHIASNSFLMTLSEDRLLNFKVAFSLLVSV